jgi:HEPN domain-containing protein
LAATECISNLILSRYRFGRPILSLTYPVFPLSYHGTAILCFDAQQAAEKAIKGLLIHLRRDFPHTHNLGALLDRLGKAGQHVPNRIKRVVDLTDYAVATRYPGAIEPVTQKEYEEAVAVAEDVVRWVEKALYHSDSSSSESYD